MKRILLLDIDGVLVQPGGYRAALRATVKRFIGDYLIEEDVIVSMENRGISSEWDMSPLIIAAYWDDVLSRQPMSGLSNDVAIAAKQIQSQRADRPKQLHIPEFELVTGQYPAETAFQAGCFASIPEGLRRNLLTESRNVNKSETFRTFQHFTLGSKNYQTTYQLPAEFEAEPLLSTNDVAVISSSIVYKLKKENINIAVFTARPSGVPRGADDNDVGYPPEAESALELVGLTNVPLIGFGRLEYIALKYDIDPVFLVKPSPVHALAAIIAAVTEDEVLGLELALNWHKSINFRETLRGKIPSDFEVVVVEDTIGGILSTRSAVNILSNLGLRVNLYEAGLTLGNIGKSLAFNKAGVRCFDTWDVLIDFLLNP